MWDKINKIVTGLLNIETCVQVENQEDKVASQLQIYTDKYNTKCIKWWTNTNPAYFSIICLNWFSHATNRNPKP